MSLSLNKCLKYSIGDLISTIKTDFPIALRKGPDYSYEYISILEPNQISVVLEERKSRTSASWLLIICRDGKTGWSPATAVTRVDIDT